MWATRVGNGTNNGLGADCVAVARNGQNPTPDMGTCMQKFSETTNQGYGDNRVGGTINEGFCTTAPIIDLNVPVYKLGVPTMLNEEDLSANPPG